MDTFHVKVITPERILIDTHATSVSLPTTEGIISILANHTPLITGLDAGELIIQESYNSDVYPLAVVGGFAKMHDNELVILADFAEHVAEHDAIEIYDAVKRAEELTQLQENLSEEEIRIRSQQLLYALTRERVVGKWKNKKYK